MNAKTKKFTDAGRARMQAVKELVSRHVEEFNEIHAKKRVEYDLDPEPNPPSDRGWRKPYDSKAYRMTKQLREEGFSFEKIREMLNAVGEDKGRIQKAIERVKKEM